VSTDICGQKLNKYRGLAERHLRAQTRGCSVNLFFKIKISNTEKLILINIIFKKERSYKIFLKNYEEWIYIFRCWIQEMK